jgi:hypothetical protein
VGSVNNTNNCPTTTEITKTLGEDTFAKHKPEQYDKLLLLLLLLMPCRVNFDPFEPWNFVDVKECSWP